MSKPTKDFTWEDLANKIDCEGGMEYYFCYYESPANFTDKKLRELALRFSSAHDELKSYLQGKGGLL